MVAAPDLELPATELARRHLRIGWWSLLLFLSMGVVLEALHGFKLGFYLDVSSSTRRHMWTLCHAHGTLLSLVHIAFAASLVWLPHARESSLRLSSGCLTASTVLLPAGFFLGGLWIYAGDPGLGIALVPLGALALFVAVFLTARAVR
jgi:hypothetical protein